MGNGEYETKIGIAIGIWESQQCLISFLFERGKIGMGKGGKEIKLAFRRRFIFYFFYTAGCCWEYMVYGWIYTYVLFRVCFFDDGEMNNYIHLCSKSYRSLPRRKGGLEWNGKCYEIV